MEINLGKKKFVPDGVKEKNSPEMTRVRNLNRNPPQQGTHPLLCDGRYFDEYQSISQSLLYLCAMSLNV